MLVLSSWLEHCRTACFVSLLFDGPLALPAILFHGPVVLSARHAPPLPV
jgi:hypothetical protein